MSFQITHATDSDTNTERDYIIAELIKGGRIEAPKMYQSGQYLPTEHVNHYVTDGEIALARLALRRSSPVLTLVRYQCHLAQDCLIVVAALVGSFRQFDLFLLNALVGDHRQQVRDAIQPRAPPVLGTDEVPGRMLGIGGLEHQIARFRIVIPAPIGFDVHRAQLPLPQGSVNPCIEPQLLLLHAGLEPVLDQDDPGVDDVSLDLRAKLEEALVLFLGAEAHDVFHAGTIVPAAIEDHDLAGGGKEFHVALDEHLALLPIGRR